MLRAVPALCTGDDYAAMQLRTHGPNGEPQGLYVVVSYEDYVVSSDDSTRL